MKYLSYTQKGFPIRILLFLGQMKIKLKPDQSTIEVFFRTLDNKELDAREMFRTVSYVFSCTETCKFIFLKGSGGEGEV